MIVLNRLAGLHWTNPVRPHQRTIYHYWYHTGENMAIPQLLYHEGLAVFVGNIDEKAPFRREDV